MGNKNENKCLFFPPKSKKFVFFSSFWVLSEKKSCHFYIILWAVLTTSVGSTNWDVKKKTHFQKRVIIFFVCVCARRDKEHHLKSQPSQEGSCPEFSWQSLNIMSSYFFCLLTGWWNVESHAASSFCHLCGEAINILLYSDLLSLLAFFPSIFFSAPVQSETFIGRYELLSIYIHTHISFFFCSDWSFPFRAAAKQRIRDVIRREDSHLHWMCD